jgi:hypothetical protein
VASENHQATLRKSQTSTDFDNVQNLGAKKGEKKTKKGPKRHWKRSIMVLLAQGKPKYAFYL